VSHYEEGKETGSRHFCEVHVKESRSIGHFVRKVFLSVDNNGTILSLTNERTTFSTHCEFVIMSVEANLLVDVWAI
jgi:hypothetical protein